MVVPLTVNRELSPSTDAEVICPDSSQTMARENEFGAPVPRDTICRSLDETAALY